MLRSLVIENFRAFQRLHIPNLSDVNLIVGKNNVGKTCLLEALRLYAEAGSPDVIWDLLSARDEARRGTIATRRFLDEEAVLMALRGLFHGRPKLPDENAQIKIGPAAEDTQTLSLTVGRRPATDAATEQTLSGELFSVNQRLGVIISHDRTTQFVALRDFPRYGSIDKGPKIPSAFVPSGGPSRLGDAWDTVTLTDREDRTLAALRILLPEIERISAVAGPSGDRIMVAKIPGSAGPVPLKSLGDGMNRILGISVALASSEGGVLLVDEVENGIHYTVLPAFWRFIFESARIMNVQVFATSHSWDCVRSFEKAAASDLAAGQVIRLEADANGKGIAAISFSEAELSIASEERIEVR